MGATCSVRCPKGRENQSVPATIANARNQRDRAWYDIVTLDESWFSLSTGYESVWLARDEKVPERERRTIQSRKFMLAIVWNPRGFHLIKVLEKGRKFNAGYHITEILESLSQ
jgi:hypothetical protein